MYLQVVAQLCKVCDGRCHDGGQVTCFLDGLFLSTFNESRVPHMVTGRGAERVKEIRLQVYGGGKSHSEAGLAPLIAQGQLEEPGPGLQRLLGRCYCHIRCFEGLVGSFRLDSSSPPLRSGVVVRGSG